MNRLLIFAFMLVFLLASTVLAVEKKETKRVTQKEVDKQEVSRSGQGTQSETLRSHNQAQPKRDYNDFVDGNNNGIDDRIESQKKKAGTDKKPIEKDVKTKEVKPDSK